MKESRSSYDAHTNMVQGRTFYQQRCSPAKEAQYKREALDLKINAALGLALVGMLVVVGWMVCGIIGG